MALPTEAIRINNNLVCLPLCDAFSSRLLAYYSNCAIAYQNSYSQGSHGTPARPPNQPVSFGQGAPQEYAYRYSDCSGTRKALLIGINYFNQKGQLRGCINDVKNMSTYLNKNFNYPLENMVLLTDDQQNPKSQPTKANILRAMHWLVKDAKPNDSLFFHYSGKSVMDLLIFSPQSDRQQAMVVRHPIWMAMKTMDTTKSFTPLISGKQAISSTMRCTG